ncbi:MAG: TatD family hydrolase [Desulfobulbus sp.]|nr:TatD family hydrolase [Desulfobulbus sp.]
MHLFDTHCHLDVSPLYGQLGQVLQQARAVGVQDFVIPGVDREGWARLMSLSNSESGIHAAPGLHPMYLPNHHAAHLDELKLLAQSGRIVAIGEIGLDYFIKESNYQAQQQLFEAQLDIARQAQLPVLIHSRKAHDQVLATLRRKRFPHGGIVHAFSGSYQQAVEYIKRGFAISVSGVITYERAKKVRKNCIELPGEWLVLETDAPDILVAGHRDEPYNLPEYLKETLTILAELRNEALETTSAYTTQNARRILGLARHPLATSSVGGNCRQ